MKWKFSMPGPKSAPKRVCFPRAHERIVTQGLTCPMGVIVDLSAGGGKIRSVEKPALERGQTVSIAINSGAQKIHLKGQVAWVRKAARRSYEIGVRWVDLTAGEAEVVCHFAKLGHVSDEFLRERKAREEAKAAQWKAQRQRDQANAKHDAKVQQVIEELEDLYAVLGVDPRADQSQIAEAYRKLARKLHPDHNPGADAAAQFSLVSKAYSILRDAEVRARYDQLATRFTSKRASA